MYPSFDRRGVEAFQISRVRYVLPLSTLGYSKSVPGIATSVPGIFTVNSSQILNGTLNVNETIQLAERAAISLLAADPTPARVPPPGRKTDREAEAVRPSVTSTSTTSGRT